MRARSLGASGAVVALAHLQHDLARLGAASCLGSHASLGAAPYLVPTRLLPALAVDVAVAAAADAGPESLRAGAAIANTCPDDAPPLYNVPARINNLAMALENAAVSPVL